MSNYAKKHRPTIPARALRYRLPPGKRIVGDRYDPDLWMPPRGGRQRCRLCMGSRTVNGERCTNCGAEGFRKVRAA